MPAGISLYSGTYWAALDAMVPNSNTPSIPPNTPTDSIDSTQPYLGTVSQSIVDLDGDGKLDILTKDNDNFFRWNQNQITYTYFHWPLYNSVKSGSFSDKKILFPTPISVSIQLEGAEIEGIGVINGTEIFSLGSTFTLTASSKKGYIFEKWSGDIASFEGTLTGTLNSPLSLIAHFAKDISDSDGDGLSNYREVIELGTNSDNNDTDGDGLDDSEEVEMGSNPNNSDKIIVDYLRGKASVTLAIEKQKSADQARKIGFEEGNATGSLFVINNPNQFELFSQDQLDSAVQLASMNGTNSGIKQGENRVIGNPQEYSLVSKSEYDSKVEELIESISNDNTPYTSGWFYVSSRGWIFRIKKFFHTSLTP